MFGKVANATPAGLRTCDNSNCGRGPQTGHSLKKCAACSCVMYCSKECQKAVWPTHKDHCHRMKRNADYLVNLDYQTKRFGFESSMALSQALHEYLETHQWACHNMIIAHILLRSGSSCAIAREEPREHVLKIRLACQTTPSTPRSTRNPAAMFKVMDHGFRHIDYFNARHANNEQITVQMLQEARSCHEANLRSPTLNAYYYVGVLPVVYFVDGVSIQQSSMIPVFRPPNNINIDANVKTILGDLTRYCAYTMSTPFAINPLPGEHPYYAVPGRYSRTEGKKWTWEALFSDWNDYHEGRTSCDRLPGLEELGLVLSPGGLMNLYTTFWVKNNADVVKSGISAVYSV